MYLLESLSRLLQLTDGWDGEDAPAPSTRSINLAWYIVGLAVDRGLLVTEVDADVLGGVAVWVTDGHVRVWILVMNSGENTMVLT